MTWKRVFSLPAHSGLSELIAAVRTGTPIRIVIPPDIKTNSSPPRNTESLTFVPDKIWLSRVGIQTHVYAQVTTPSINIEVDSETGVVKMNSNTRTPHILIFSTNGKEYVFLQGGDLSRTNPIPEMDWYAQI